ncbi:hypothetical protein GCM10010156_01660 [Planobispora rosea]|uniref:Uncharacterized protein n=1 Tax=Planobispora rosea TaxID=35762 RepID=A0A8J3WBX6_PLARO|nr:hypothetical protein GCM10010156_01660 [Planobispora rosea]GIH82321.1 hypothetical protein Pro02_07290 [Planobispora rosea]
MDPPTGSEHPGRLTRPLPGVDVASFREGDEVTAGRRRLEGSVAAGLIRWDPGPARCRLSGGIC